MANLEWCLANNVLFLPGAKRDRDDLVIVANEDDYKKIQAADAAGGEE